MIEKGFHCFSKYHRIYTFIGTEEKTWEEIKRHLVKNVGGKESTARAQMQVALAERNLVVIEEDGLYRLNPEMIATLLKLLRPLHPKVLRIITQSKLKRLEAVEEVWRKKYYKLYCEKLELEYGFHDAKAEYYANRRNLPNSYQLKNEHLSKAVHAHHELNDLKKRLKEEGIDVDE